MALDELAIEAASEREVGTQEALPGGQSQLGSGGRVAPRGQGTGGPLGGPDVAHAGDAT